MLWAQLTPPPPPHQGPEAGIKTQTCRSASWPAWPPLGGWPARVQRWRGCSGACCPCPSPPRAGSAGRLCCGRRGAALGSGYTAGTVGWGSPVGSEDEEKPPHIQAMATETESRHETGDSGFIFFYNTADLNIATFYWSVEGSEEVRRWGWGSSSGLVRPTSAVILCSISVD